jgi:protein transport protein SEC23
MSPDESCYNRLVFSKESVSNALVMMQPSLICYSFQAGPVPVLLDAARSVGQHILNSFRAFTVRVCARFCSVRSDVILLLDTFFHVLVFHGETIAAWREEGYAERPEHDAFRALLQAPKEDAATIMSTRFPVPRYIVCDQHKSQARFLMAKLNPSVTHNNMEGAGVAPVFTDDVSFSVFMDSLVKLSTSSS